MGEKQSHDAAVEARRDVAQHKQLPATRTDAIGRYLAGIAYQTSHDKNTHRGENGSKHRQHADEPSR